MDKFIGFDIDSNKTVACVVQKGPKDRFATLLSTVQAIRQLPTMLREYVAVAGACAQDNCDYVRRIPARLLRWPLHRDSQGNNDMTGILPLAERDLRNVNHSTSGPGDTFERTPLPLQFTRARQAIRVPNLHGVHPCFGRYRM